MEDCSSMKYRSVISDAGLDLIWTVLRKQAKRAERIFGSTHECTSAGRQTFSNRTTKLETKASNFNAVKWIDLIY